MIKAFVIRKRVVVAVAAVVCAAAVAGGSLNFTRGEMASATVPAAKARLIQLVTGEFETKTADGKMIEAYRWDPGTIYVKEGEHINLSIRGISGDSHPFVIEGLSVKGEVRKGKETVVSFHAAKKGIYRLICLTHSDAAHDGPMIGYIVVD